MCVIDTHAQEAVYSGEADLSLHAQGSGLTVTVLTEERTRHSPETSANWHRLH